MVLVSGAKFLREIITHDAVMTVFILAQKGKNGVQNAICPSGDNVEDYFHFFSISC